MITAEMLAQAELSPVLSRSHDWADGEQAEYDSLRHRGRSLYDNLRTQFDVSHADAFKAASAYHGTKR